MTDNNSDLDTLRVISEAQEEMDELEAAARRRAARLARYAQDPRTAALMVKIPERHRDALDARVAQAARDGREGTYYGRWTLSDEITDILGRELKDEL